MQRKDFGSEASMPLLMAAPLGGGALELGQLPWPCQLQGRLRDCKALLGRSISRGHL